MQWFFTTYNLNKLNNKVKTQKIYKIILLRLLHKKGGLKGFNKGSN